MLELLKDLLDLATQVDAFTRSVKDASGAVTLNQRSEHSLTFELSEQPFFDHSSEVVTAPDFLDQGGTKGPYLLLELFLAFFAGFLESKDKLFDEPRLFATVCDR